MVFDKTGTLTEDGLTCNSSKIKKGRHFEKKIKAEDYIPLPQDVFIDKEIYTKNKEDSFLKYSEWMAACHQVTVIRGNYYGDPLDVEMLKTIKWVMPENDEFSIENKNETFIYPPEIYKELENNPEKAAELYRLKVVHKFDFSSALQRMSVVVSNSFNLTNQYTMYIKGSPEAIQKLWDESTYPRDYEQTFKKYTQKGLRVISLAYKYLPKFDTEQAGDIDRKHYETLKSFVFLGFLIFINKLKPETKDAIKELQEGKFYSKSLQFIKII